MELVGVADVAADYRIAIGAQRGYPLFGSTRVTRSLLALSSWQDKLCSSKAYDITSWACRGRPPCWPMGQLLAPVARPSTNHRTSDEPGCSNDTAR